MDDDFGEIYEKLMVAAKCMLPLSRADLAHDFASDTIVLAIEALRSRKNGPWGQYWFLRCVMKKQFLDGVGWGSRAGKMSLEFTRQQIGSVETALKNSYVLPNQEDACECSAVIERLAHIGEDTARAIVMQALGFSNEEIASELGIKLQACASRINWGRSVLRNEGYFDDFSKKATKFVGVYRNSTNNGKPWKAMAHVGKKSVYIGAFDTASKAAKAYDEFVKTHDLGRKTNNLQPSDERTPPGPEQVKA